jgi:8-oxo-dGTP pyrophosphatase MutT (NUDIX family)
VTDRPKIVDVDQIDCRLVAHRWAFAEEQADELDRRWRARLEKVPSLYDGPVLLACHAETTMRGDACVLRLDAFETRFSRFLCWRDLGWPDKSVFNCFAMPAVRASDGAYLVGEMGTAHSAAGQRYFPGGTPDPSDVVEGSRVDLAGSLIRELAEETGLSADEGRASGRWTVIFDRQRIACIQRIDWPAPAAALRERVRAFIAAEAKPELADVHLLPAGVYDAPRLPAFMTAYLAHAAEKAAGDPD